MAKKENRNKENLDTGAEGAVGTEQKVDLEVAIRAAFDAAHAAGKEEDDIKLDMIGAGATFKNVTRMFNQFSVDAGLAVSKEEKDQILLDVLNGSDLADEATFNTKVEELMAHLTGATDKSAAALIRAYAKKNGIEAFKKAKVASGEGRIGFTAKFYDFLIANPTATKEEAVAFIDGTNGNEATTDNTKRNKSHYLAIHRMVNRIAGVEVAE